MGQIVENDFGAADLAAHPATLLALQFFGMPDTVDFAGISFPFPVTIVGLALTNKATQAGDTIAVQPTLATVATGPVVTNSFGSGQNSWWAGPLDAIAVPANTVIGVSYITVSGGTYGVNDVLARLFLRLPLEL